MGIVSKVKQSIILTADGQIQSLVAGSAANITKCNIMSIYAQSSAADAEIKIYNEIGAGATAAKLIYHGKLEQQPMKLLNLIYQVLVFMLILECMLI